MSSLAVAFGRMAQQAGQAVAALTDPSKHAMTITPDWAAIIVSTSLIVIGAGITHLKIVWDIRGDLRHGLEEIKTTRLDVDQIKDDVQQIKLRDEQHEARIAALERVKS